MSANDIIYLDVDEFTVSHQDIEGEAHDVKKYKTLNKAITAAHKLQTEYEPEYGIFILKKHTVYKGVEETPMPKIKL